MDFNLYLVWIANGFLTIIFILVDNLRVLLLIPPLAWMYISVPGLVGQMYLNVLRPGVLVASLFALFAGIVAPDPVAIMLLIMIVASCVAAYVEKFRPDECIWTFVQGVIVYSLVGVGLAAFQYYLKVTPTADQSNLMTSGRTYIGIIAAVALWATPIGYLALLVKGLLVHAPFPGNSPENVIDAVRGRPNRFGR